MDGLAVQAMAALLNKSPHASHNAGAVRSWDFSKQAARVDASLSRVLNAFKVNHRNWLELTKKGGNCDSDSVTARKTCVAFPPITLR